MVFDGFLTRAMVQELREQLLNGRLLKIYQPFEQELHLSIRSNRANHRFVASIHSMYYRAHLTDERPHNPTHAPMFCMLLRKHLENAIILDIRQVENDRIIEFELSGRDELGDLKTYVLIFELMGKHSNIILINAEKQTIIDCIKHVSASQNTYRLLQPGATYVRPPKQDNITNVYDLTDADKAQWCKENTEYLQAGKGFQRIQGMSKLLAQTVAHWMSDQQLTAEKALQQLLQAIQQPQPTLITQARTAAFHALDLTHLDGERQHFANLSQLVETFYTKKVHADRIQQISGDLLQKLTQLIERNQQKLIHLEQDRQTAQNADTFRIKGELLNAFSYQVQKCATRVTLDNYYANNAPIEIELDPRKTAIENSQAFFKKYTKYRDALRHIEQQETLTQAELAYLEGVWLQISQADIEDIEDIKQELAEQGYHSKRKTSIKKRAKSQSKPRQFTAPDGTRIWVGRNNQQNDELSLKTAAKTHWWLHAKNIPGAHVIIENNQPTDETITLAAEIAAYYSKFQHSANVPVDMIQVKHLKKPNGSKPGFVIYEGQKTVFVTPNETNIIATQVL
ncbi:MAG: NFACT RNA binding domain-containing protein [Aerococcaceae bacterium]|nr:NFACT RNA binding domain-containing protein [Aerococcaceae bacterium]